ncbi:MAG: hypothetical protein AB7G80_00160 [Dongiaceae bacterium]
MASQNQKTAQASASQTAEDAGLTLAGYGVKIQINPNGQVRICAKDPAKVVVCDSRGGPVTPANNNGADIQIPRIGDRMTDGTIYAGTSPTTDTAMFALPEDSGGMSWNDAVKLIPTLAAHGHKGSKQITATLLENPANDDGGLRLPTLDELNVLYKNREAIGGFSSGRSYWSASERGHYDAYFQHFDDGLQLSDVKDWVGGAVRFVRSLARQR